MIELIDSYQLTLKFVPGWFVTNEMIEKLDNAVFSNEDIVFGNIDSNIVINLIIIYWYKPYNNISLDDDDFDNNDPKTINHVRRMA